MYAICFNRLTQIAFIDLNIDSLITMPGTCIKLARYNSGDITKELAIIIVCINYIPIIRPFQEWESSTDLKPSCQNITIGKLSFSDFCGTLN